MILCMSMVNMDLNLNLLSPTVFDARFPLFLNLVHFNDSDGELGAVSDASSTHYSTCQSNDSDGELGTVSDHSVNDDPIHDHIPIPSIEQVTIATQKTQPQVPKPTQTVDPSCAQHVKSPRQPIRTPVTSSPIPSNNRQNWNQRIKRDLVGASRFNTGKQHVNSGSVHVNSGTQIKSAASRFNTGKQHINSGSVHVNTARVNRPVSNNTSPKPSQVNLKSPKKCFSKQRSPVNRPFSRNTAHKSNKYAVKGKMGTAVKTSAGCVWRKVIPLSNTNSGPTPDSNVNDHPLKHMEHRGIFDSGCSGHMTGNRAHLEDYQELSKVGSVTFGGSKGSISGKEVVNTEYVAAASCCGQVLWLQNQLLDYGFNFMNTIIHIDNQSTICIIKNPVYHSKTKHIEIRHHFIRDCYEKKLIQVQKIHTDLNVADLLTKPFDGPSSKSGGWDQFGSNIATALICLSTGRDFNFSKLIFDGMISNLKGKSKFLMYPRFLQMILNIQTENKNLFVPVLLTKKIFGNMKRSFQGIHRPLLPAMLTIDAGQPQPSAAPTPSQPVPTPTPSHVQIPPPPITQPPPTPIQPVQSTSPPPQPSSEQLTSSPPPIQPVQPTPPITFSSTPITTIPDTQPTLPPSPQIPSPSYHDTEGPSFEPSYHMSPPPSHEPEIQTSRTSEESEQLRNLLDLVPRLESRVESLEKELSDTKQTLGTAILQLIEKVKKLENKLRQKRKSKETEDAEGQDQDIPSPTDQGNKFATPEKSKGSGEAQEEQISPSTLEAAQILTNVASEGFKGSQAPLGSKIYRRKPKSTPTPTKILHFEEPAETQVNTGSTPSAQVNTAEVNTAELNTGETERVQRRKGKDPMTEEDLQAEVQASKKSKELQELAGLEAAQRLQATMDAETQRQIDLDALLARRLVEQEEEAAKEALATEFDYIQARLNADQIFAEKIQQEEREQYSIEERAKFLHDTIAAQRKFLAEQRNAAIRNKPPTISQLRNQMITYLKHVANKKHAELKSKSFEEIQVLYERYKKQDQTFVAIGSEEDERAIKRMNEQAADKEKEQKNESVHEEVKEEEGAKKRKLGTRKTEEESPMALELIKFVKQQLEDFGDSDDNDTAKSDYEEGERVKLNQAVPSSSQTCTTHVQITPPPISQPPSTLTHPVQSTSPPPQPSSAQPTSSPPPIQPVQNNITPPSLPFLTSNQLFTSPQIPSPSYLIQKKVKKLENKLRKKRKSEETKDAEGQDQEVPSQTDQDNAFATPEKSKDSGEAQEEQISPSTLEAAQILTKSASRKDLRDHKPLLVARFTEGNPNLNQLLTKILHFEEPAETQVNTGSTPSAQVNTAEVNTAELNTGETERVQRRKGKDPMTEEDLQAEVQHQEIKKTKDMLAIKNKPPTISHLINQMITYLKHVANKKHAELKSKSFEEIQALYERYKKQDQTFVAIGSEEDERAIKKMNEKDIDKEKEQKADSVHEEVKEEEGAKKRKLGTRRKLKAKRRKHASGLTREDDDLKICLHIAPDEDKVIDVESLDHQYPLLNGSFLLRTKLNMYPNQTDPKEKSIPEKKQYPSHNMEALSQRTTSIPITGGSILEGCSKNIAEIIGTQGDSNVIR
ncbi:hypothetical protein Tco_0609490 [Tanacetum coccineum]